MGTGGLRWPASLSGDVDKGEQQRKALSGGKATVTGFGIDLLLSTLGITDQEALARHFLPL